MTARNRLDVDTPGEGVSQLNWAGWDNPHPLGWAGSFAASPGDSGTSASAVPSGRDNTRMIAALETYMEALRAGRPWSRDEFLAQHAEIAEELGECLSALEFIQTAAVQLAGSSGLAGGGPAEPHCAHGPARRLPHPPRGRAGGHGRGLRGRAGLARAPGRLEGPPVRGGDRPQAAPAVPDRGPGGRPTAPPSHRADLRRWAATRGSTTTPCSSSTAAAWPPSSTNCAATEGLTPARWCCPPRRVGLDRGASGLAGRSPRRRSRPGGRRPVRRDRPGR